MTKKTNIVYDKRQTIYGDLHVNQKSSTLIILCHGFQDSKDTFAIKRLAEILENEFNVYRFTFTDRENPYLPVEEENIALVIKKFRSSFKRIVIVGASLGGLSVFLTATGNLPIDKLILINPFVYLHKKVIWKFRRMILSMFILYPFVKKIRDNLNYYYQKFHPGRISMRVLFIVAGNDEIVSPDHGKILFQQIGSKNKQLIIDDVVDHGLSKESFRKRIADDVTNWLSK